MASHRDRQNRTAFRPVFSALGGHARTSTLPVEMRTTAEAAAPPADRVRKPRSFKRAMALWFTALLFFIAFLGFVTFVVFGTWLLISGRRLHGMIALAGMGTFIITRGLVSMLARAHWPPLPRSHIEKSDASSTPMPSDSQRSGIIRWPCSACCSQAHSAACIADRSSS